MSIYGFILGCHSILRWAVVGFLVALLVRTVRGFQSNRRWTERDERLHVFLISFADVQLLLGLLLYFWLSPLMHAFLEHPGAAMKQSTLRFFGVEHTFSAILALVVLHVGRARSRRSRGEPRQRHRQVLVSLLIALVLVAVTIPWPFLPYGRPLLRGFGG
jgi:hypothetical protein